MDDISSVHEKFPKCARFVASVSISKHLLKYGFYPLSRRDTCFTDAPHDRSDRLYPGFGLDRWKLQNNMVHIIIVPAGLFRKQELNCEKNTWTMIAN